MNIDMGKYILKSDALCMWIEEKRKGKTKDGKETETTKRVTGYAVTFEMLINSFMQRKIRASEAECVQELLEDMAVIEEDMKHIAEYIGKELDKKVKK